MLNTNFSPWPSYSEEEVEAVADVLRSNKVNYWTGNECKKFEEEFAAFSDTAYSIALTNGTNALELALIGLGVGAEDEVIVTPRSFIASVSSVEFVGATPVFADVDRESQNISAETLAPMITAKTKAVIVVHLAGMPADMTAITEFLREKNIAIIEDCAQAHGAKIGNRSVGSFGNVGAWSFCQDKIMTTGGEGGMVTTSDIDLYDTMWEYKDHGKSKAAISESESEPGFKYVHNSFGTNWRMTEMQAALGRYQLKQMTSWQAKRLNNATRIWETASALDWLRVPAISDNFTHAAYKAYVFVNRDALPNGWNRDRIVQELIAFGVPCYQGICPEIYKEKAYSRKYGSFEPVLPIAKELGKTSLMFLVHPTLSDAEIEHTCSGLLAIDKILKA